MTDTDPIAPHGGTLVDLRADADTGAALKAEAANLPKVVVSERELSDLEMIAVGALSPLTGFQGSDDYHAVLETMHLTSGLPWAIPVTLSLTDDEAHRLGGAEAVALLPAEGAEPLAVLRIHQIFKRDKAKEAMSVYRTEDTEHPGVAAVYAAGDNCVAGTLEVIALPAHDDFPNTASPRRRPARRSASAGGRRWWGSRPQPDPPRTRVHPEVRARDRGRVAGAPPRGRDEGRRRARRGAHAVLRGAVRGLLPEGPRDGERVPRPMATRVRARPSARDRA